MLRIMTFNANGIRSATEKGFWSWFDQQSADILCVQELKAQTGDLGEQITQRQGYQSWFHCAQKKGYSGCGIWSRQTPENVAIGFGNEEFDQEGRYVRLDFPGLSVISAYFPSGTSGEERQEAKYRFLAAMKAHMQELQATSRQIVLCGDLNIAHKQIDIKNWKANQKNSGFLPEERAWVSDCLDNDGWVDVFRRIDDRPDQFTWWSQRGRAREKNVGWRIDYQLGTPAVAQTARAASVYRQEKFSDHAPVTIDYEWEFK